MAKLENHDATHPYAGKAIAQRTGAATGSAWDAQVAAAPQRTLGNQALTRRATPQALAGAGAMRTAIQTKLTVGPAQDAFEREADTVAAQVVNDIHTQTPQSVAGGMQSVQRQDDEEESLQMKALPMNPVHISTIQRAADDDEEDEIEAQEKRIDGSAPLQRRGAGSAEGGDVSDDVEASILSQRGGGVPLPEDTRSTMEPRFGTDFGSVRVHQGAVADSLNQGLSARAFTSGSDIFFRSGEYDPNSKHGQELLAHELTHVVQQRSATPQRK